jgi:hypothetical protein
LRILLELFALFFAITTIYRRLIEPFFDGLRSKRDGDASKQSEGMRFKPSGPKKKIEHPDPKEIQDAEFEEIK